MKRSFGPTGLSPMRPGTAIGWTGVFEDAAVAARIRHLAEPANEQNLDRLEAVPAAESSGGPA